MPRSKSLNSYPTEFYTIAEKAGRDAGTFVILCANEQQARSLAGRYYAFLGALKKYVGELREADLVSDPDAKYKAELLPYAHKVYITLCDGQGRAGDAPEAGPMKACKFQHRSESWYAKLLREGLEKAGNVEAAKETLLVVEPKTGGQSIVPAEGYFAPEAIAARLAAKERKPQDFASAKRDAAELLKGLKGLMAPEDRTVPTASDVPPEPPKG